jgi:hypothetical protein
MDAFYFRAAALGSDHLFIYELLHFEHKFALSVVDIMLAICSSNLAQARFTDFYVYHLLLELTTNGLVSQVDQKYVKAPLHQSKAQNKNMIFDLTEYDQYTPSTPFPPSIFEEESKTYRQMVEILVSMKFQDRHYHPSNLKGRHLICPLTQGYYSEKYLRNTDDSATHLAQTCQKQGFFPDDQTPLDPIQQIDIYLFRRGFVYPHDRCVVSLWGQLDTFEKHALMLTFDDYCPFPSGTSVMSLGDLITVMRVVYPHSSILNSIIDLHPQLCAKLNVGTHVLIPRPFTTNPAFQCAIIGCNAPSMYCLYKVTGISIPVSGVCVKHCRCFLKATSNESSSLETSYPLKAPLSTIRYILQVTHLLSFAQSTSYAPLINSFNVDKS